MPKSSCICPTFTPGVCPHKWPRTCQTPRLSPPGSAAVGRGPASAPAHTQNPPSPRDPCPLPGLQSWHPTHKTQHFPFTAALLSPLSPVLPPFPGAACSAVKSAEAHWNKHSNPYGPQEERASFHNSSSPLRTTLLYWPIFYCWLQHQSWEERGQTACTLTSKKFGLKGFCLHPHNSWVSWLAELRERLSWCYGLGV